MDKPTRVGIEVDRGPGPIKAQVTNLLRIRMNLIKGSIPRMDTTMGRLEEDWERLIQDSEAQVSIVWCHGQRQPKGGVNHAHNGRVDSPLGGNLGMTDTLGKFEMFWGYEDHRLWPTNLKSIFDQSYGEVFGVDHGLSQVWHIWVLFGLNELCCRFHWGQVLPIDQWQPRLIDENALNCMSIRQEQPKVEALEVRDWC